jgi:hypothetical protein
MLRPNQTVHAALWTGRPTGKWLVGYEGTRQ